MKKEKKLFGVLNKDVPEKEWEANYLVEKSKDIAKFSVLVTTVVVICIISLLLVLVLAGTIQCSASVEFEGKGNIVLNEAKLSSSIEKFEFEEGKVKFEGTVPCSFLTSFGMYGGK